MLNQAVNTALQFQLDSKELMQEPMMRTSKFALRQLGQLGELKPAFLASMDISAQKDLKLEILGQIVAQEDPIV